MFIELEDGNYLNETEIVTIKEVPAREPDQNDPDYSVVDRKGNEHPIDRWAFNRLSTFRPQILPAIPGEMAVIVTWDWIDGAMKYSTEDVPILGWAVAGTDLSILRPVLRSYQGQICPTGLLIAGDRVEVNGHTFASREEFAAAVEARDKARNTPPRGPSNDSFWPGDDAADAGSKA